MRIMVLSINYWPEETGIGPVTTWRCEYLASRGHDVTVCTTFPYYPQWKVDHRYRHALWREEKHHGVTILRSRAWVPARLNSVKRILFETSFLASNLLRALSARTPELLLVVSPPLGLALTARILGRYWRIPFVYDVMDLQPDAAAELGMLRPGTFLRTLYGLEGLAYRHADLISTLTEGMRQRIIGKAISPHKVTLFPARSDRELLLFQGGAGGEIFRRAHGLEGKFIVAHSGNMGVKQGLDVVLGAAALSRDRTDIVYLLVGHPHDGRMPDSGVCEPGQRGSPDRWPIRRRDCRVSGRSVGARRKRRPPGARSLPPHANVRERASLRPRTLGRIPYTAKDGI